MTITKLELETLEHCLQIIDYDCGATRCYSDEAPEAYQNNLKYRSALKRLIKKLK